MARLVKHERNKPYQVTTKDGETLYMCACGLSKNKPFCDGSHKATADEEAGQIYMYDGGKRIKLENFY